MTAKTLSEIAAEVEALDCVNSAQIWNDRRVYVNIAGKDGAKAGDRNAKVFYDVKTGWNIDGLKGTMSSDFHTNIRAFAAIYCRSAFWRD
jgi:hypothetical protein